MSRESPGEPIAGTIPMRDRFDLPDGLRRLTQLPDGGEWLRGLPEVIAGLAEEWHLALGRPYEDGSVSWVAPVTTDGAPAVLKVQFPHRESEGEADALAAWDGNGAARLLRRDDDRHALLLEQCRPGTHLARSEVDHLAVLVDLLPALWVAAPSGIRSLADESALWAGHLQEHWVAAGQPCERRLVDLALQYLEELPTTQGPAVLLHQDLHGDNVLAAERRPWLAIDPKPLAGEREFAVAPIVRSFEFGHSAGEVTDRLQRLCAVLDLDEERAAKWTIAQTVAWSFDSQYATFHHDTARWLAARFGAR